MKTVERPPGNSVTTQGRPRVILDVHHERGLFFLLLRNIGSEPAVNVVTKFGPRILGPDGKKEINGIGLFRGVAFFPPGKQFRVLLGAAAAYFSTKQPTKFPVSVTYQGENGKGYSEVINHNLEIYRDLPQEAEGKA